MRAANQKIVAILPARNVARTVAVSFDNLPRDLVDEVILVDNASHDDTAGIAEKLGITVIRHPVDRGYGGSLKTCCNAALEAGADWILEFHPDNQYDSRCIPLLIETAQTGNHGLVMGSRFIPPRRALEGGMPWYKYLANRTLSFLNAHLLGVHLSEFHTGFRVYKAEMLRAVNYRDNSNDFRFSFEIIAQCALRGFTVAEIPSSSRYFEEASSNPFWGSLRYGYDTLAVSVIAFLHRKHLIRSHLFDPPPAGSSV